MDRSTIVSEAFWNKGFIPGRMVGGSKSRYRDRYPDNEVYFNANIIVESLGKIWFGDLDITTDKCFLEELANEIDEDLYIVREHDARFDNEESAFEVYKSKAVCVINKTK
jgi:hypothetical protein